MKIGLWNIDHPEHNPRARRQHGRFLEVAAYLQEQECDLLILTEANAALPLAGYHSHFSAASPYFKKGRCYNPPNQYHQVGMYSKRELATEPVAEPVNGLLGRMTWQNEALFVYGNVITIKDQWRQESRKTYTDRLQEQLAQFKQLLGRRLVVCGDFNLRRNWPQKRGAYKQVEAFAAAHALIWPTAERTDTVQHVLHSADLQTNVTIDFSVKDKNGRGYPLSDHPLMQIEISDLPSSSPVADN